MASEQVQYDINYSICSAGKPPSSAQLKLPNNFPRAASHRMHYSSQALKARLLKYSLSCKHFFSAYLKNIASAFSTLKLCISALLL